MSGKRPWNRAFAPSPIEVGAFSTVFVPAQASVEKLKRPRPSSAVADGVEEDNADIEAVLMDAVASHLLTETASAGEDLVRAYRTLPCDSVSLMTRQRLLLARFDTREARLQEHARLQSAMHNLRAGRLVPSQICPGVPDDNEYVKAQIFLECEDQLRALELVLSAASGGDIDML